MNDFDDLIVGALGTDANDSRPGSSYVIFGRSDFTRAKVIESNLEDGILVGGAGDSNFRGNDVNDTIDGGIGSDVIIYSLGIDILLAGFGEDQLSGNENNDIFSFYALGQFEVKDLNFSETGFISM